MLLLLRCRCLYSETSCWQQKPDFTQKQAFIFWIQFCYKKIFCLSQNFLVATLNNSADCQFISYKNYKSFIHLKICWSRLQHNATCCRCREEFSDPGYHGYQKTAFNPQIASHTQQKHETISFYFPLNTHRHINMLLYRLWLHQCTGCDVITVLAVMSSVVVVWVLDKIDGVGAGVGVLVYLEVVGWKSERS